MAPIPPASPEDPGHPELHVPSPGDEATAKPDSPSTIGLTAAPAPPKPARKKFTVEPEPVPVADVEGPTGAPKIRQFEQKQKHDEKWQRQPNTTGQGAIHVKTFYSKLTADALKYMDETINQWLDEHPEYEVKFVTSTVGVMTGKLKEPALMCQVWV